MGHPITISLTEDEYRSLVRIAGWAQWTPEECVGHWVSRRIREVDDDKILKLAGCIESDIPDIAARHDEAFAEGLREEIRSGG